MMDGERSLRLEPKHFKSFTEASVKDLFEM